MPRLQSAAGALLCAIACWAPGTAVAKTPPMASGPSYYVALGDSLSRGAQPFGPVQSNGLSETVPTKNGYVNFLYATERRKTKHLRLEELGCLGETTATMINGGICHYAAGSQLAAAVRFIKRHRIAFITIDIGANDVDGCTSTGAQLLACVANGVGAIQANVPKILSALRRAAAPGTTILGMTYYDPFLSAYFGDSSQQALAMQSVTLSQTVNGDLANAFKAKQVMVADVAAAFSTYAPWSQTATLPGRGKVPVAVAKVCELTWVCAPAPRGPNIHANAAGYKKIARVFAGQL